MTDAAKRTVSTADARDNFAEVLNRAAYGKERVVLSRRGKPLVAVVPVEDIAALEAIDDARDSREIQKRLQAWERAGRPGVTIDEYAKSRGMKLRRRKK